MKTVFVNSVLAILICAVTAVLILLMMMGMSIYKRLESYQPQHQEPNEQFEESNHMELQADVQPQEPLHSEVETPNDIVKNNIDIDIKNENNAQITEKATTTVNIINTKNDKEIIPAAAIPTATQPSFFTKLYTIISIRIRNFINAPKVIAVMSNIGTCLVNGAMEIVSFYFPAPLIPLIASAAGLVIPFEPVVMLRERMPVDSYRRAFQKAVTGFLGTFDKYKYDDNDPYMTRRFNRGDTKAKKHGRGIPEEK